MPSLLQQHEQRELEELRQAAEKLVDGGRDPAHDWQHIMRVYRNAEAIGREEGADMKVLLTSALLHDLVVYPKGSAKHSKSSDDSADLAEKLLLERGWPKDKVDRVSYCIRIHSYSKNIIPSTLEGKILQDADRLDALGAIGIARTFSVGGTENRPFYNPSDPFCESEKRQPDDRRWTLDHFQAKLLKLHMTLHTPAARRIARERTKFMELFTEQLRKEISSPSPPR
ncbi:MAG: phosphohydrolase [Nitrososphaera sp.]